MASSKQERALDESFIPSSCYNELPHISSVTDAVDQHQEARDKLLQLIFAHKANHIFSVRLIHKHFDVPEDHVMVYETFESPSHPTFQIFGARSNHVTALRGKHFLAVRGETMKAFEYTSDPLPDVSQYAKFINAFSDAVLELGLERIFGLTVRSADVREYNEIELPDFQATVLVQSSDWLSGGIATDWMNVIKAEGVGGVPIYEASSGGRCVPSVRHTRATFEDVTLNGGGKGTVLSLDGVPLNPQSEAFNILSHAAQYISVM